MSLVAAVGRFWWGFVVGDDWVTAAGVGAAVGVTALLAATGLAGWWLLPPAAIAVLYVSLRRAVAGAARERP